jgi:GDP-4-dehydro-6-deoxy-D-mannose reductase
MAKKILITGATGFVGGHLIAHLLSLGKYEIFGTYRSEESLKTSLFQDKIKFVKADLSDKEQFKKILSDVKPDAVFHLAAQAAIQESIKNPLETLHNNIDSQLFLFEGIRELGMLNTKLMIVLSADVYGYVLPEDLPIDEDTPFRPGNPYAVSKIACDFLAYQYFRSYKLPIVRIRAFTHIGPGQKTGFVTSDFAKQIAEIEKQKQEPVIRVGNLDAKRDFTDVRDMVKAYALLLEEGEVGEVYNIGSGRSHKISEVLEFFLSKAKVAIKHETDSNKLRPSDIPDFVADYSKMHKLTGWKPEISFEKSLEDILNFWREQV